MADNNFDDNKNMGFIRIFRSIKNHWLWQDEKKLKWWFDILISANYSSQKVLIKGSLIECGRGQSIKSLETWAKDWLTTKKTVQTFFKLLSSDRMILIENLKVTTRITVCNYDSYNNMVNATYTAEETESKRSLPPNNKGNKDKKVYILPDGEQKNSEFLSFCSWIERNAPSLGQMEKPITQKQYEDLKHTYTFTQITDMCLKMDNNKALTKKYKSAHFTLTNWIKNYGTK